MKMPFSNSCQIKFDSPSGVFYSGQHMTGTVVLTLLKEKKVKGLFIELKGNSKVKWTEYHGTGDKRRTVYFQSREDYFSTVSPLIRAEGSESIELQEGEHKFDFSYGLPHDAPSSFAGLAGSVQYTAKVIMERPWKINKHHKVAFTVLSIVDLNMDPMFASPISHRMEKKNFSLFSKSGILDIEALMPGTGFVPGQSIPIKLNINNESNASVDQFVAHLTQIVTYFAAGQIYGSDRYQYGSHNSRNVQKNKLIEVQVPEGVEKNTAKEIEISLEIPSTPPTTMNPNHNIIIAYYIKVIAQVSGMHRNLDGKFPITIGTVPFYGHHQQHQQQPDMYTESHSYNPYFPYPGHSSTEPSSDGSEFRAMPPSYQECTQSTEMRNDDDDGGGTYEKGYKPRYPVYNIPKQ